MKTSLTTLVFFLIVLLFSQCNGNGDEAVDNNKDLGQNMLDMKIYHDNLGTNLRKEDADIASWLLEGMDSSLQMIAANFKKHPKLTEPFEKTYQNKLKTPITEMRKSLEENNFPNAVKAYRLLTNNCNTCHKNHDIDEEVFDLSDPANN